MINFLAATLFGAMISFMVLISPIVFNVLTADGAKKFLRKFFPRLFTFGLVISTLLIIFTFREFNQLDQTLSVIIFLGVLSLESVSKYFWRTELMVFLDKLALPEVGSS